MEGSKRFIKMGGVCGIIGLITYLGIAFILEKFWMTPKH
jgi:hypothetical protein